MSDKSNTEVKLFGLSQYKHAFTLSLSLSPSLIHTQNTKKTFGYSFLLNEGSGFMMKMKGVNIFKYSFSKRVKGSLGRLIVHCHSSMTSHWKRS